MSMMDEHKRAMAEEIDPEQLAAIRRDQAELLNAFRAKHGCDPDDCGIDLRKCGDGRVIWSVRKLSVAEREWKKQNALNHDVRAMTANATAKPKVYAYTEDLTRVARWMFWLKRTFTPAAVFLSERGARQEGGPRAQVYELEVRA